MVQPHWSLPTLHRLTKCQGHLVFNTQPDFPDLEVGMPAHPLGLQGKWRYDPARLLPKFASQLECLCEPSIIDCHEFDGIPPVHALAASAWIEDGAATGARGAKKPVTMTAKVAGSRYYADERSGDQNAVWQISPDLAYVDLRKPLTNHLDNIRFRFISLTMPLAIGGNSERSLQARSTSYTPFFVR